MLFHNNDDDDYWPVPPTTCNECERRCGEAGRYHPPPGDCPYPNKGCFLPYSPEHKQAIDDAMAKSARAQRLVMRIDMIIYALKQEGVSEEKILEHLVDCLRE